MEDKILNNLIYLKVNKIERKLLKRNTTIDQKYYMGTREVKNENIG